MKICLVTTFPPSRGGLSEYGFHIARELQRNPALSLTILADELSVPAPEPEGFSVERCWSFGDPTNPVRILRALSRIKPDVVWFSLLFSTFGRNPVAAFSGLMTPVLVRLSGRYTHITLHHLMDTVDLKDAGIRFPRTYRLAGRVATEMLLLSNSVSVLMPGYRTILSEKYGGDHVHVRSHGVLTHHPEYPDFSQRGSPEHRILAFGKWGTYKRLELLIEAFAVVQLTLPKAKLVIAGGDHPQVAGYVESVRALCAGNPQIEFTGYVSEDALPGLFQRSTVAVMPYSSSAGSSGVAYQACAYGVPIVCADLPDFRQMAAGEELAFEFYEPGNAQDLANCLIHLLENPDQQQAMAKQNFASALRMTMPNIVQKYLRHFELQQRIEALHDETRPRGLRGWGSSRNGLLRTILRNSLSSVHNSAILRSEVNRQNKVQRLGAEIQMNGEGTRRRHPSFAGGTSTGRDAGPVVTGAPTGSDNRGVQDSTSDKANGHLGATMSYDGGCDGDLKRKHSADIDLVPSIPRAVTAGAGSVEFVKEITTAKDPKVV